VKIIDFVENKFTRYEFICCMETVIKNLLQNLFYEIKTDTLINRLPRKKKPSKADRETKIFSRKLTILIS